MNDLKFAFRQSLKSPGFTLIAVLVLALGIGANTAVFSLVNALVLKPILASQPDQLMRVYSKDQKPEGGFRSFSYPNYADLRQRNTSFASLAAFDPMMVGVKEGEFTKRAFGFTVSANWFSTFGVQPARGRDFLPEEEAPGAGIAVVIVSHTFWERHGADPALVGRTVTLNGRPFEVIGVAPEGFTGTAALFSPDLWLPLGVHELLGSEFGGQQGRKLNERDYHVLMLLGRLKPGVTSALAEKQLQPLADQLALAFPKENKDQILVVAPPARLSISNSPQGQGELGASAGLGFPMAGVVLLIACLNLANMLLARGAARQREFAIRVALGGGRWRMLRQLLTEGLLLALAGGILALALAQVGTKALASSFEGKLAFLTITFDARPDVRVLAATFFFCVLATLLFALLPAWKLSGVDVVQDLKEQTSQSRRSHSGWAILAPRNLLVVGQIALSFLLLAVAGLFYRGSVKAGQANPGFRFEQGLLVEVDASLAGLDEAKGRALYTAALGRLRSLPGVEAASVASTVPFGMYADGRSVRKPGTGQPSAVDTGSHASMGVAPNRGAGDGGKADGTEKPVYANYVIVSDDYFRSLGVALLRGREFDRLEAGEGSKGRVCIISDVLARRLWPGQEAVGRQLEIVENEPGRQPPVLEIVGVAPSFRQNLGDEQGREHLYVPLGQAYQGAMNVHLRLRRSDIVAEKAMLPTVRQELRAVSDRLPVLSMNTLRDFHNEGVVMWMYKVGARLFFTFAMLALTLAVVGVYGVKAFVVARRTREIGIRIALGASRSQVLWMVLRDGIKLTAAGLVVGLVLALGVGQLLRSNLYEVNGADPGSFAAAFVVLAAATLLASYLPARRATKVEPMTALRHE